MFVEAIEAVGGYTRPIFTISRRYGSETVDPGAATMFFVNDEGWAVTARHVAQMVIDAAAIERKYGEFLKERDGLRGGFNYEEELRSLENRFGYMSDTVCEVKVNFVDSVDRVSSVQCKMHPQADLALIRFEGFMNTIYKGFAIFGSDEDEVKQGKYLCRIGFPFPEFTNYGYDKERSVIGWTKEGNGMSPRFPMDGIVTRLIGAQDGVVGIELSTPGLKGQAGGPLFDRRGIVYGMQSGISSRNLGKCVHMRVIKDFLLKEGVSFHTENGLVKGSLAANTLAGGPVSNRLN